MSDSFSHTNSNMFHEYGEGEKYAPPEDPQFLLLRTLETRLERFLDIYCLIQKMDVFPASEFFLSKKSENLEHFGLSDKGFLITFPFSGKTNILIIPEKKESLPSWYRNPGVAGKSRLSLFAQELSDIFPKFSAIFNLDKESQVLPLYGFPLNIIHFLESEKYFAGRILQMETLCRRLVFVGDPKIAVFTMTRFDGSLSTACLVTAVENPEILKIFADHDEKSPVLSEIPLKPVRALETVSVISDSIISDISKNEKSHPDDTGVIFSGESLSKENSLKECSSEILPEEEEYVLPIIENIISPEILAEEVFLEGKKEISSEIFLLSETPDVLAVNTEELIILEEENLFPFQQEKFQREFSEFLLTRKIWNREAVKNGFSKNSRPQKKSAFLSFYKQRKKYIQEYMRNISYSRPLLWWEHAVSFLEGSVIRDTADKTEGVKYSAEDMFEAPFFVKDDVPKESAGQESAKKISSEVVLRNIPVFLQVLLGKKRMTVTEILNLREGSILNFENPGVTGSVCISDTKIAQGKFLFYEDYVAVEVSEFFSENFVKKFEEENHILSEQ
ncbi:MAG: FliM/FliN family flagellar motor switch protein [Planctomycetia bacterium]|nr:FliM/FliN family flagellar motor switch protein [Planctomycetia bacterium]